MFYDHFNMRRHYINQYLLTNIIPTYGKMSIEHTMINIILILNFSTSKRTYNMYITRSQCRHFDLKTDNVIAKIDSLTIKTEQIHLNLLS